MKCSHFLKYVAILCGVVLDQIAKNTVVWLHKEIVVAPFFSIRQAFNPGVSFGLLHNLNPWVLITMTSLVSVVFIVMLVREKKPLPAWSYVLVISGALSNIMDRVFYGGVLDFLDFHLWGYYWPTFNFADVYITLGAVGLLIDGLRSSQKSRKKVKS